MTSIEEAVYFTRNCPERDLVVKLGLDSAGYFDGSDSVMLMMDGSSLISQASNKNETNIVGIGFTD